MPTTFRSVELIVPLQSCEGVRLPPSWVFPARIVPFNVTDPPAEEIPPPIPVKGAPDPVYSALFSVMVVSNLSYSWDGTIKGNTGAG